MIYLSSMNSVPLSFFLDRLVRMGASNNLFPLRIFEQLHKALMINGKISAYAAPWRHIAYDHRAETDTRPISDTNSAGDYRIGADPYVIADNG